MFGILYLKKKYVFFFKFLCNEGNLNVLQMFIESI